jgi:hypothetical protein
MTPPPITSAGNRSQRKSEGHSRRLNRRAAPSAPRRVSGPAEGRAAAPVAAATRGEGLFAGAAEASYSRRNAVRERPPAADPAPRDRATAPRDRATAPRDRATGPRDRATAPRDRATAPRDRATGPRDRATTPRERRWSGPAARPRPEARPQRRRAQSSAPLGAAALTFARSIPDHPLLDRVVRGRVWIALLGAMLLVIVAMQVSLLQLGAGTGVAIQKAATLAAQNQSLRAKVGTLADDQRIEGLAAGMGMVMPAPTAVTFLSGTSTPSATQAAAAIAPPAPSTWEAKQTTGSMSLPVLQGSTSSTSGTSGTSSMSGTASTGAGAAATGTGGASAMAPSSGATVSTPAGSSGAPASTGATVAAPTVPGTTDSSTGGASAASTPGAASTPTAAATPTSTGGTTAGG